MKKLVKKIKLFFILFKADRELRKAIKKADQKCKMYNRRFYVIPNDRNRLIVCCWSELKGMKRAGFFYYNAKQSDFIKESFYYTGNTFGEHLTNQQIKQKRKEWIDYIAYVNR